MFSFWVNRVSVAFTVTLTCIAVLCCAANSDGDGSVAISSSAPAHEYGTSLNRPFEDFSPQRTKPGLNEIIYPQSDKTTVKDAEANKCNDGYYVIDGDGCEPCIENCKICSGSSGCDTCNDGFYYDLTTAACLPCEDGDCKVCNPADTSSECKDGSHVTAGHTRDNSGTCGNDCRWTIDDEGTLTISGSGGIEYTTSFDRGFVKSVIIQDGK